MCRKMIFIQPRGSPALVSFFAFDAVKSIQPRGSSLYVSWSQSLDS